MHKLFVQQWAAVVLDACSRIMDTGMGKMLCCSKTYFLWAICQKAEFEITFQNVDFIFGHWLLAHKNTLWAMTLDPRKWSRCLKQYPQQSPGNKKSQCLVYYLWLIILWYMLQAIVVMFSWIINCFINVWWDMVQVAMINPTNIKPW